MPTREGMWQKATRRSSPMAGASGRAGLASQAFVPHFMSKRTFSGHLRWDLDMKCGKSHSTAECGRAVQAGASRGARRAGLPTAPTSIRPSLPGRCDQAILTFVSTNGHSVDIRNENWTSEMRTDTRRRCSFSNPVSKTGCSELASSRDSHVMSTDIFSPSCPFSWPRTEHYGTESVRVVAGALTLRQIDDFRRHTKTRG